MNGGEYGQVILIAFVIFGAFLGFMAGILFKIKLLMDLKIKDSQRQKQADQDRAERDEAQRVLNETLVGFVSYYKGQATGFTAPVPAKGLEALSDPDTVAAAKKQNTASLPKKKKGTAPTKPQSPIPDAQTIRGGVSIPGSVIKPKEFLNTTNGTQVMMNDNEALLRKVPCIECDESYAPDEAVFIATLLPSSHSVVGHRQCVIELQNDYRAANADERTTIVDMVMEQQREIEKVKIENKDNPEPFTDQEGVTWRKDPLSDRWVSESGDVCVGHPQ